MIPASLWSLLNILLSPDILERVLEETRSSLIPGTNKFDIATLCAKPLLTSIYLEALRYSVAVAVARNPSGGAVNLNNWIITPGTTVLSISWFGAHDSSFWNAGPGDSHPVNSFWPERFLQYPNDPSSGPIKNREKTTSVNDTKQPEEPTRTATDCKAAKATTAGTEGHFYPYGGGVKMCPGRFFAKQEMLASIAVMLQQFEIELTDIEAARKVEPDTRYFPVGAMPPKSKVPIRIRRRQ